MNYDNYMELYEAIYLFNRINYCIDNKTPQQINKLGLNESIYKAILRILVVNNLLDYFGNSYTLTNQNREKLQYILDNVIDKNQDGHYIDFFNKAINKYQFFFDSISESEYEIYSRYNFNITLETGKKVANHLNLATKKVLELGGNSGGLGSAILTRYKNCSYTNVDTKIPCAVGNELNKINKLNISFIQGNIFKLNLPSELYDYIILMNLLHDFDDMKCLNILRNCTTYCDCNTKFVIIEDMLTGEFEPKEVIMHGLRLSVECRGGKQRTIEEMVNLFSNINYKLLNTITLDNVHTMLVMGKL